MAGKRTLCWNGSCHQEPVPWICHRQPRVLPGCLPSLRRLGAFARPSAVNHSCLANTERSFLGDYMIVGANKKIPKDTEITMSYSPSTANTSGQRCNSKTGVSVAIASSVLPKNNSTVPACPSSPAQTRLRNSKPPVAIAEKGIPSLNNRTEPAGRLINQVKLYVDKIEDTYPDELFAHLPKIALVKRHGWLMKAYAMMPEDIAIMYAQAIVRDHGFKTIIETVGSKVSFDRSNIIMTTELVDAFSFMGLYYGVKGNLALSRCMKKMALENYIIMNGSAVGFKVAYGV